LRYPHIDISWARYSEPLVLSSGSFRLWPETAKDAIRSNVGYWGVKRTRCTHMSYVVHDPQRNLLGLSINRYHPDGRAIIAYLAGCLAVFKSNCDAGLILLAALVLDAFA
jgi:hypothetical protein